MQGVGFRPVRAPPGRGAAASPGFVRNDARGVEVEAEGAGRRGRALPRAPGGRRPAAGPVEAVRTRRRPRARRARLRDRRLAPAARRPRSSPPTPRPATTAWPSCFDPADRRFRYPFVNCTNCGPRFTIVRGVPYDRPRTTMAGFAMCDACRRGVRRPRRPALPRAAERVPGLRAAGGCWRDGGVHAGGDAVAEAAALLRDGAVVAVKGLGGYHLACRAGDADGGRAAARAQAPRGEAVRADGGRRRGGAGARRARRRGGGAADLAGASDRAGARGAPRPASRPPSRPARASSG